MIGPTNGLLISKFYNEHVSCLPNSIFFFSAAFPTTCAGMMCYSYSYPIPFSCACEGDQDGARIVWRLGSLLYELGDAPSGTRDYDET